MSEILLKYFPDLSVTQLEKLRDFERLTREWNQKINLISRKDIDNLYERHILHSMAIAKVAQFAKGCRVMDVGTGGGFPGIPLAILFPEAHFFLVDSIRKKIMVIRSITESLKLGNVKAINSRVEDLKVEVDFVVARAVTETSVFYGWVKDKIRTNPSSETTNGLFYLKGLNQAQDELRNLKANSRIYMLSDFFEELFFDSKALLHVWK